MTREEKEKLLKDYWVAQAQFGPFEVGPEEFLRKCEEKENDNG